jgi:hypothetical protein
MTYSVISHSSKFRQQAAGAVDWILTRRRPLWNGLKRARTVFHGRALVVRTHRRVGANDEKVVGRRQALVARAGRQDDDIAALQREYPALPAAEADASLAARDAEHLMDPRVIVHIVVDAVAPDVSPSVRFEQVFNHGPRVVALIEVEGTSIDD